MSEYQEDIPQSLAGAYNWLSHSPERRFANTREEYANALTEDLAAFEKQAAAGGTQYLVAAEFTRYREGMRKRWVAAISSDSRCASSFITGPSNFPARRMQKRNDIAARRWNEAIEWRKRAKAAIMRTLRPDLAPIMASDSDAVERIKVKIAEAEALQERMRAVNAAHKRYLKDPASLNTCSLPDSAKDLIARYKPAYSWEPHPYAPYQLTNNSAEIRRLKARLTQIETLQSTPDTSVEGARATFEDCPSENRVRLIFPGKPDEQTRTNLKRNGFRWAPSVGAWQA